MCSFFGCTTDSIEGSWDYTINLDDDEFYGTMKLSKEDGSYTGSLASFEMGDRELENIIIDGNKFSCNFRMWGEQFAIEGNFNGDTFSGNVIMDEDSFPLMATKLSEAADPYNPPDVQYLLADADLQDSEKDLDHFHCCLSFCLSNIITPRRVTDIT